MKVVLIFFCCFNILLCKAQESTMSISAHQDLRLLFIGDDRGNGIFTLDLLVRFEFEAFKLKKSSFPVYIGFEYSDLNRSSLMRFMIGIGFVTRFNFLDKFLFGFYIDHGLLARGKSTFLNKNIMDESTFMGLSCNLETTYPLSEKIRLSLMYQLLDRQDLSSRYGGRNINGSVFLGVKFAL